MMKIIYIILIYYIIMTAGPVMAAGELVKLKAIGDSLTLMDKESEEENINYQKAQDFINSQDIKEGVSSDFVLKECGEPVAKADNNTRWVYKPSSSTFFKGEKVYLYFDKDNSLKGWEQIKK